MLGYVMVAEGPSTLMADLAGRLEARGLRLGGAVQIDAPGAGGCAGDMDLRLLPGTGTVRISQTLGPGSGGCRLDPGALEQATERVLAGLADAPELLLLSKFGRHEAEGRGLRSAVAAALEAGVPVLTTVTEACRRAFLDFAGGLAEPVAADAAETWALAAAGRATVPAGP